VESFRAGHVSIGIAAFGTGSEALLEELEKSGGESFRLVRRSESLEELMGACQAGLAQVSLFLGGDGRLDATTVDRLRALGVVVLALHEDQEERERLIRVGALTLPSEVGVAQVEDVLKSALEGAGHGFRHPKQAGNTQGTPDGDGGRPIPPDAGGRSTASSRFRQRAGASWSHVPTGGSGSERPLSPWAGGSEPPDALPVPAEDDPGPDGPSAGEPLGPGRDVVPQVLVVWGPAGAPGRTTVAVNLAAELALDGRRVILLDADSYGPSVAAFLGLLDESAGLAQACRLADRGRLDLEALTRVLVPVVLEGAVLDVLSGITRPERWTELRGAALTAVVELCTAHYDHVVIDAGFCLEADEELSFDTMAPRRNASTLCSLECADRVYAVGESHAVGLPRLVRSLTAAAEAAPRGEVVVLMNKVRQNAVGRFPERQLREAWGRFGPSLPIRAFLPYSPEFADPALRDGRVLAEAAPESELRRSIQSLVCAPAQRSRKSSVFYATTRRTGSR